ASRFERETTRYLRGLEQHAVLSKSESGTYAVLADGRRVSRPELQRLEREAWAARHGKITYSLADLLATGSGPTWDVGIVFETSYDWKQLGRALEKSARQVERRRLEEAVTASATELVAATGPDVRLPSSAMPMLLATLSRK